MSSGFINIPAYGSPSWKDPVASTGALPASNNSVGDARFVTGSNTLYVWSGSNWVAAGGSGGGGIQSINGDSTSAQVIQGTSGISAATASGTTNIQLAGLNPNSSSNFIEQFDEMNWGVSRLPVDGYGYIHPGGQFNFYASGISDVSGTAGRPGQVAITSSSSAQFTAFIISGNTNNFLLGNGTDELACLVYIPVMPNSTNNFQFCFGYGSQSYSQGYVTMLCLNTGISTTNWACVNGTNAGGSYTYQDSGTAFVAGWNSLRLMVNAAATSVGFYVNGTLIQTLTTNIPTTGNVTPFISIIWTNGASCYVNVDWMYRRYQLASNRGTF